MKLFLSVFIMACARLLLSENIDNKSQLNVKNDQIEKNLTSHSIHENELASIKTKILHNPAEK